MRNRKKGYQSMIRRMFRYPYTAAKNISIRTAIGHRVKKRIRGFDSLESTESWQLDQTAVSALQFLEARRHTSDNVFEYRYSAQSRKPTLYASVYACIVLSLLGRLRQVSETDRLAWSSYFDSFQSEEDGLFYDQEIMNEIYPDTDWWGARHLALQIISAYTALGMTPKYPFRFLQRYYDTNQLGAWLDESDWADSVGLTDDVDNKIMNIGCLLQY